MYELVGQGNNLNLYDMPNYETSIEEGQRCQLRLHCIFSVPPAVLGALQGGLDYAGVEEAAVTSSGNMVYITFRKGFAWLAVIASIILGLVLALLITIWQIFREVGPAGSNMLIAGGLLVVVMVFYAAAKKESPEIRKAASRYYPRAKQEVKRGIQYLEEKYGQG